MIILAGVGKEAKEDEKSLDSTEKEIEETEDEKIAELGRPRLGDNSKCRVRIKESMEFKVITLRSLIILMAY